MMEPTWKHEHIVYQWLTEFFQQIGLYKVNDPALRELEYYFTDPQEEKYLLGCKIFQTAAELARNWETAQDVDLAIYLQDGKYAHSYIRWDMYFLLLYVGEEELPLPLIHKIEHDKFCSRKVVLTARSKLELVEQMNFKLPLTREFYNFKALEKVGDDREFFNLLRAEAGLTEEIFPDELFRHLITRKADFVTRLEGGANDEDVQD